MLSRVRLFVTPWAVAHQTPLSMGFSRQKYWSGFPFPSSGDLPPQGSNPHLLNWQADSLPLTHQESPILSHAATAAAKSLQSCPTLCDPRDGSPPGSPVPGILQARTREWVAISFSNTGQLATRRQWHPTPVLLPGKSHGWRSLVGCSPWGR